MSSVQKQSDVILIGAGAMSATLGSLMKELAPQWSITILEKLDTAGAESSNEWNNAGTGHSALCELNYTIEKADGSIDLSKGIRVSEQFQLSKQYWAYLVEKGLIKRPQDFIMPLPHISMVQGKDNVKFLKKRYEAMKDNHLFSGMEYSEDPAVLSKWIPLMMEGRTSKEPIAASKMETGTDVNFGAMTRILVEYLQEKGVAVQYNSEVKNLSRTSDGQWELKVKHAKSGVVESHKAKFVFIGAGGGSLHLVQKSGIPEGKGIGGFPVSGLFLVCNKPEIVEKHFAKVYGKAKVGAPPMSVPHLDTRYIDGKKSLLFGPFAGFSPKFLKSGSYLDLITAVKPDNLLTMCAAGCKELKLTKYLIEQVMLSDKQRVDDLRDFVPTATLGDWEVVVAGQRVQVIKDTKEGGKGTLQFGTEVITAKDGSVAALLGASPGASIAVYAMLDVLERCFPKEYKTWEPKIKEMIPSYGIALAKDAALYEQVQIDTGKVLGLTV